MSEVAFRRTDARLAGWLVECSARLGRRLEPTHESIAGELGTAREAVRRLLEELERRGHVRLRRGTVDRARCARTASACLAGRDAAGFGDEITDARPPID